MPDFTGEGIYYALRSGELAAQAIISGDHRQYSKTHRQLYAGRLWVNALARRAVEHPRLATRLLRFLPNEKRILALMTGKVVRPWKTDARARHFGSLPVRPSTPPEKSNQQHRPDN